MSCTGRYDVSTNEGQTTTTDVINVDLEAKFFGNETPAVNVQFGGATHTGLVRSNNEDHYAVVHRYRTREVLLTNLPEDAYPAHKDSVYAFAVADGVGGAAFGELASELALRTGWELTTRAFKWGFSLSENEVAELEEGMKVYAQLIHRRIKSVAENSFRGMGTTLTGALTVGWDAFVVHIGDSRAYLHRGGNLFRLTDDQTLAELMVKSGIISSVDQAAQRFRNTLMSCLGGNYTNVDVQTSHITLEPGDQLLVCTDGLSDMVPDSKIVEFLKSSAPPPSSVRPPDSSGSRRRWSRQCHGRSWPVFCLKLRHLHPGHRHATAKQFANPSRCFLFRNESLFPL